MKFLGTNAFSLPEVTYLFIEIVDLFVWVLIWMLFGDFLIMYYSLGMVALDFDGLWNDQLNCILDSQYD